MIVLQDVSKSYRLYRSRSEQAIDVLGLTPLLFWRRPEYSTHPALDGVNVTVTAGERVALVGRNGAGKTSLLKLITGNFHPSSGQVEVRGRVQALMNLGIGFHPEFSGRENVRSSLAYSGLVDDALEAAVQDVIGFSELGEYLDQPLKTYSAGMQARLMFAAATAVKPDILIVDEILSAGDAYFSAKSSHRMDALAKGGCTLLLVSHSMPQVLQFCQRAVWLETGRIVMDADALSVVKAYEEYSNRLEWEAGRDTNRGQSVLENAELRTKLLAEVFKTEAADIGSQEHTTVGGVSRWSGEPGIRIERVRVVGPDGTLAPVVRGGSAVTIEIEVEALEAGRYPCSFVVVLFTNDGRVLSRHCSDLVELVLEAGGRHRVALAFERVLLGQGTYFFSAAVYKELDLQNLGASRPYDLLSRSFEFRVLAEHSDDPSLFLHPSRWSLRSATSEAREGA